VGIARGIQSAAALPLIFLLFGCPARSERISPRKDPAVSVEAARPSPAVTPSPRDGSWIEVRRAGISRTYPAVGIFLARRTTRLGSQVNGRVQEVLVDVGDRVKKGQELIRLDPTFFEIELARKKAEIDTARIDQSDAELNFERMKNLWMKPEGKEPSVPRKLFDDAKTRHERAAARLRQSQEAIREAEEKLDETRIRAPYDGVISDRMVDPGEPVTSAPITHLIEVQEIDILDLEFSLPQDMISRVRKGTGIEFDVEGVEGGPGSGEISAIYPAMDEKTRSFRCRVQVKNEDLKYRPGLLVKVRVVDREVGDTLVVPARALSQTAAGWQALVLVDERPERRSVQVGLRTDDRLEIKEGLVEGDRIWLPR